MSIWSNLLVRRKKYVLGRRPNHHTASLIVSTLVFVAVLLLPHTIWVIKTGPAEGATKIVQVGHTSSTQTVFVPPASASAKPGSASHGSISITQLKNPAHAYGVAAGSRMAGLSEAQLNNELNDMASMGVTWLRFDIEWSNVQPDNAGQQHWNDYDRVVKAARVRNFNVLAILDYTPGWARHSGCGSAQCAPRNPAEFAAFATLAVKRYAPQGVKAWEIWNEPNSSQFWAPQTSPTAYASLLKAAYPAIKSADSEAMVITGGLAPQPSDGQNLSRRDFLQQLYAAGAKDSFDAVADHPYTFPRLPADNTDRAWSEMSTTANSLRATMIANGDSHKKIWITEYGAPTNGPGPTATPADSETVVNTWHVDEALQANMLKEAVRLYKTYDWVGPFFWYSNNDAGTDPGSSEHFFGLVRADGSHKPAYNAYSEAIR